MFRKIKMKNKQVKIFEQKKFYKSPLCLLIIALLALINLLIIRPIYSAQAQAENEKEASEESTISNIKKVIQDKKVELEQNNQQTNHQKQAYLAQVKRVSAETLTVLHDQLSIVIPVAENFEIIKEDKSISLDQIEVDDWVLVYSILQENTAKVVRIVVTNKDFTKIERKIVLGAIVEIYPSNLLFDSRTGENNLTFLLNMDTQYLDANGEEMTVKDFYPELQCLIVAKQKADGQWQATSIKALAEID